MAINAVSISYETNVNFSVLAVSGQGVVVVADTLYVGVAFVIYLIMSVIKSIPYLALCLLKSLLLIFRTSFEENKVLLPETYRLEVFHEPLILRNHVSNVVFVC